MEYAVLGALIIITVLLVILLLRKNNNSELTAISAKLAVLEANQARLEKYNQDEFARSREDFNNSASGLRTEVGNSLSTFQESTRKSLADMSATQIGQLGTFSAQLNALLQANENRLQTLQADNNLRLENMRETIEKRLTNLQEDNSKKLDQMRATVDEKLHATLEKRLGDSFRIVSERLEQVHKGLGEMQNLAAGVGDLKKVLTNVKTRGIWGEMQLAALLEQVLTPEQYAVNVATKKDSRDRVEFAIKLPGNDGKDSIVWLPIDAKFPQEDYQRLMEAQEQANAEQAAAAMSQLESRIKNEAKSIREKYIDPPNTTDFAILFLPVEGLYAEVLRCPGLSEFVQREYRVNITGPTTLAALLNSLQMGFRTLAIEKRSGEVWSVLGSVKTEFGKFGDILEKTRDKLDQAGKSMDAVAVRTRAIERKLRDVQELPAGEDGGLIDN